MACIRKNKLGKGFSYTIQVKVKDNKLNKYVTKYLTWKKPNTMTDYQAKREVDKLAFEFESKVRKQMSGMLCKDNDKTFEEYATEWLARAKKNKSPTYYVRTRALIETMKEYFGKIKLKDITPSLIQCFIDKIQDHKVVYEYAVMKKDIKNHLLSNHIKPKNLKKITGVGDYTYQASRRNEHVRVESAKNLCKGLGIDFNEYYDVVRESHPYAKESILKYNVLQEEHNLSLVNIQLITGRHHQIRVQFSYRNHALVGDQRYGSQDNKQICLCSYKLSFFHPITKERLEFIRYPKGENWNLFDITNL